MNIFFWRKNAHVEDQAYAPYEEIDAKRTSKLGYFFLVLMVIFGIFQGNNFLNAVQNSIATPERNSACLSELAQYAEIDTSPDKYYQYSYQDYFLSQSRAQECVFSAREKLLALDDVYNKITPDRKEIQTLNEKISTLSTRISGIESQKRAYTKDYQTSLLEDVADTEKTVFNQGAIQTNLVQFDAQIQSLSSEKAQATARVATLEEKIKSTVAPFGSVIQKAYDGYAHDIVVYEFKQFLLSLVLIAPLFAFVWRYYNKLKVARSEYTIIWGGAVATVGFIFAQILLVFVYQILPHEIIQKVLAIFASIKILWALLYWLGFILVPLFFGFLIYLIQKKFYNKRAVMMRALKSGHCPNCSLTINRTMNNCPVCGYSLKTKCTSCGSMSMDGGSFCEACGVRRNAPQQP